MLKIRSGFPGQRLVVFPFYIMDEVLNNPVTSDLAVHSMGFFPNAKGHYVLRPFGCPEFLLIYCTKGKGGFSIEGKEFEVGKQQFFILPANKAHCYWSDENDPWSIYWVHFRGSNAPAISLSRQGVFSIEEAPNSRKKDRMDLFDEILNIMEKRSDSSAVTYVNMCFHHLLATFIEIDCFREARFPKSSTADISFLSRATHYMEENMDRTISIREMAEISGCSESNFYRRFHSDTGYSPNNFFLHLKINKAKELLENTNLKIKQIAPLVGFDDPYFFSRSFKSICGKSPREWRQTQQNN